jgi:hypothetical protein
LKSVLVSSDPNADQLALERLKAQEAVVADKHKSNFYICQSYLQMRMANVGEATRLEGTLFFFSSFPFLPR